MTLPLVPFEQYMLSDDRPAYPMSFFVRLRFSGQVDRQALERAFAAAAARHPLLAARVEATGRRAHWAAAHDALPPIAWHAAPASGYPRATPIDLRREPGLRAWCAASRNAAELVLQFHHACCDGQGAFRFVEDLLVLYAQACGNGAAELAPLDDQRLRNRGKFGLTARTLLPLIPGQLTGLLGAGQFMLRKPLPLVPTAPPDDLNQSPEIFPTVVERHVAAETIANHRIAAQLARATSNDLLARDLFLALAAWREQHWPDAKQGWLRMAVPVSLRFNGDRQLSAANMVSMVFLDRHDADFRDPAALLAGIHDEMDLIKRRKLGLTFVFSLGLLQWLPGGIASATRADQCAASCVFTNPGAPLDEVPLARTDDRIVAGNLTLEDTFLVATLRPYTHVAIAAMRYAGRLNFSLQYDPRAITGPQAGELLEAFVQRVHRTAGSDQPRRQELRSAT